MNKWWESYPWRIIQTNLREIDMVDMNAARYVNELKAFDATIAMLNFGGIISSYKTDLDCHYQSPFLKADGLSDIISACHGEGIKVIARNDFSKVRFELNEKHPQWAYRDINNRIIDFFESVKIDRKG